jgi:hypothetical protein
VVDVNYLAILVSSVLSMVLGSIWFGPLFGKQWMKLMKFTKESMSGMNSSEMGKLYGLQFLGSLIMNFVLAHNLVFASSYLGESGISAGLQTGFWTWLGFFVPATLAGFLWEGKSFKLWVLNQGYYLVLLLTSGVVLALWV